METSASSVARLDLQSLVQEEISQSTPSTEMFLAVRAVRAAPPSRYWVQTESLTALLYLTLPNLLIWLLTAPTTSSRLPPMVARLTAQVPVQGVTMTVPSLGPSSCPMLSRVLSLLTLSTALALMSSRAITGLWSDCFSSARP